MTVACFVLFGYCVRATIKTTCILPSRLLLPRNNLLLKNSIIVVLVIIVRRSSAEEGFVVDFYFGRRRRAKVVVFVVMVKKHTSRIDLMMTEKPNQTTKKFQRTREPHRTATRRNQSASSVGADGLEP
jgi:hypothetical protein